MSHPSSPSRMASRISLGKTFQYCGVGQGTCTKCWIIAEPPARDGARLPALSRAAPGASRAALGDDPALRACALAHPAVLEGLAQGDARCHPRGAARV